LNLYWYRRLNEAWDEEPRGDWFIAGDHGHKPKNQVPKKLPTYQDLLDEFGRRMEKFSAPSTPKPSSTPSVESMILDLEKRTGVKFDA
jgi:hypothetical protein